MVKTTIMGVPLHIPFDIFQTKVVPALTDILTSSYKNGELLVAEFGLGLERTSWIYDSLLRDNRKPLQLHHRKGPQWYGEIESLPLNCQPYVGDRLIDLENAIKNAEKRGFRQNDLHLFVLTQELYGAGWHYESFDQ